MRKNKTNLIVARKNQNFHKKLCNLHQYIQKNKIFAVIDGVFSFIRVEKSELNV